MKENENFERLEVMGPKVVGYALSQVAADETRRNPAADISQHLHICVVYRGQITLTNNDHTKFGPHEKEFKIPTWPKVGRNYSGCWRPTVPTQVA